MKKTTVIFIPRRNPGSMDAVLPMLVRLSAVEHIVPVVLPIDRAVNKLIASEAYYADIIERYGVLLKPWAMGLNKYISLPLRIVYLICFLLRERLSGRRVVSLYAGSPKSQVGACINEILDLLSDAYYFPPVPFDLNLIQLRQLGGEALAHMVSGGQKIKQSNQAKFHPKRFIAFTAVGMKAPEYEPALQNSTGVEVGMPRLSPEWKTRTSEINNQLLAETFAEIGIDPETPEVICFILTNPHQMWFETPDTYIPLCSKLISKLREAFPETPILLKPKPSMIGLFTALLEDHQDDAAGVYITTCPLPALSVRTKLAVTICESGGVLEFALSGVPVVEYEIYNDDWLSHSPEGSAWCDLPGLSFAYNDQDFDNFVEGVKSGKHSPVTREALEQYFQSSEDLTVFTG